MAEPFRDKVVLITGASSGIGEATARAFAAQGCSLILAARRLEILQAQAQELESNYGMRALAFGMDASDPVRIEACVQASLEEFGKIDVLFNNAGFGGLGWLESLDAGHDIELQFRVNALGMILMARSVLPTMQDRRQGHIINMASNAAFVATPTYTIYAATKFAVRGFTEALRRECLAWGIHVSAIYPGGVATAFGEKAGIKRSTGIKTPSWLSLSPEKVADAVVRCVRRPKRAVVLPAVYHGVIWINRLFPGVVDWATDRFFVRRERSAELLEE